jgi:hypothetical protein
MFTRRLFVVLLVGIVLALPRAAAGQEAGPQARERWFVLEISGQRAGWMHTVERSEGERFVSSDEMVLEISRGGVAIRLDLSTSFTETRKGEPVSATVAQSFGGPRTETANTFGDGGVREVTETDGRRTEKLHPPIVGEWLTPREADRYLAQRLEAGAEEVHVRTIDLMSRLEPVLMTYSEFEPTTLELLGRTVKATRCRVSSSLTPTMASTEFVDNRGTTLMSETDFGGMKIVMIAADRELALSDLVAPEMMTSLFIKPDRPIPGARTLDAATYLLSVPDGDLPDIPETGSQKVERVDARTARVTVDARAFAPAGEVDGDAYLESSSMLDTTDELIRELAERAVEGVGPDPRARAEALRRFVYRHIRSKSLGVGFASASEVARSCEGDCSEHGTLLAALLRADGIPSRVASGVVYVDAFAGSEAVFGYHMWTQALLEVDGARRWVDLDATLPGAIDYDATHIALGLSTLGDSDAINGLVQIAPMLGRLRIAVASLD